MFFSHYLSYVCECVRCCFDVIFHCKFKNSVPKRKSIDRFWSVVPRSMDCIEGKASIQAVKSPMLFGPYKIRFPAFFFDSWNIRLTLYNPQTLEFDRCSPSALRALMRSIKAKRVLKVTLKTGQHRTTFGPVFCSFEEETIPNEKHLNPASKNYRILSVFFLLLFYCAVVLLFGHDCHMLLLWGTCWTHVACL